VGRPCPFCRIRAGRPLDRIEPGRRRVPNRRVAHAQHSAVGLESPSPMTQFIDCEATARRPVSARHSSDAPAGSRSQDQLRGRAHQSSLRSWRRRPIAGTRTIRRRRAELATRPMWWSARKAGGASTTLREDRRQPAGGLSRAAGRRRRRAAGAGASGIDMNGRRRCRIGAGISMASLVSHAGSVSPLPPPDRWRISAAVRPADKTRGKYGLAPSCVIGLAVVTC